VKDWWGADLPISAGRTISTSCASSSIATATSASRLHREELSVPRGVHRAHLGDALRFPAIKDGRVKQAMLPDDTPSGGQGWFMNTRREKFKNRTLREAVINAFDFEWTNKTIMYGAYKRTVSVFQNSNMMAEGKPGEAELALLEPFRGKVPDEVFAEPLCPAGVRWVGAGSRAAASGRRNCCSRPVTRSRTASGSMPGRAGYDRVPDRRAELPAASHAVHQEPRDVGIDATLRLVDPVQFSKRRDEFDYDITVERFNFSATPGDLAPRLFLLRIGRPRRVPKPRRDRRSGRRHADREDHRGADAG
jgi:microcin C transport system substrate-binding protein